MRIKALAGKTHFQNCPPHLNCSGSVATSFWTNEN